MLSRRGSVIVVLATAVLAGGAGGSVPARGALVLAPGADNTPWHGGIVPYEFAREFRQRPAARFAMRVWSRGTHRAVRFVPRHGETSYVVFRNRTFRPRCAARSSAVGERAGAQYMTVTRRCGASAARLLLVHELGHLLGLFHEQGRPDRDRFIAIHLENARERGQFDVLGPDRARPVGPFDLRSAMLYGPREGSANGRPVMTLRDGSPLPPRTGLPTHTDLAAVRSLERRAAAAPGIARSSTLALGAVLQGLPAIAPALRPLARALGPLIPALRRLGGGV